MSQSIAEIKKMLAAAPDTSGLPIAEQRRYMDAVLASAPLPGGISYKSFSSDGVQGEWIDFEGAAADRVVLYLHGGGYTMGSPASHRRMTAYIARAAAMPVFSLDYRLAPEHPFPAAVHDAAAGYRCLLQRGYDARTIAIAGDSAGGGLTVAALLMIRDGGDPVPCAGVCISPWADLTGLSETYKTCGHLDPLVQIPAIREMAKLYLDGQDPATPLASPVFADLSGLPPLLIQVGTDEVLLGDSIALDCQARQCGVESTLEIWKDMIHVWHFFCPDLAEGADAVERVGSFIGQRMPA